LIFYILQRKYAKFKSFLILSSFVLLKEIIDASGYLKLEVVGNPLVDTTADIITSYTGAVCVYLVRTSMSTKELEETLHSNT